MRKTTPLLWLALALSGAVAADDVANERLPKQGLEAGKAAFLANCAACHQPEGTGMAGAFPPLAGSDFLTKNDKQTVLASVLKGISGKITVNGNEVQRRDAGDEPPDRHRHRQHRHLHLRQLGQPGWHGIGQGRGCGAQDPRGHQRPSPGSSVTSAPSRANRATRARRRP